MKRRSTAGVVLAAIVLLVAPSAARGPHVERFVVFGDSLSDTGNDFIYTTLLGVNPALPPSRPPHLTYFNGRFSNGLVAFEYLWGLLNGVQAIPIAPFLASMRVPQHGAVSFAFGASGSGITTEVSGVPVPGLGTQIELFRDALGGRRSPDALFALFTGANDYIVQPGETPANPVDVVDNIARGIAALYRLGARNIIVPNLPDLGAVPIVVPGSPTSQLISQLVTTHNRLLALRLEALRNELPAIRLVEVDVHTLVEHLPPGTNVTIPALDVLVPPAPGGIPASLCIFVNPLACPNVPTFAIDPSFFFWDAEHPTTAAHRLLGTSIYEALQQEHAHGD